jgi:hypothetical protein
VIIVGLTALVQGACHSSGTSAPKNELLHGRIAQITLVDSEHGDLNGVFSPKIIYDLYVNVENSELKTVKVLVTEKTHVFEQRDRELQQVAIGDFRPAGGNELEATVGDIDKRYRCPEAIAVKLVILKQK